jgi:hypothetical protein
MCPPDDRPGYLDEKRRPWRRERIGLDGVDPVQRPRCHNEDADALITALSLSVDEAAAELG